MNTYLNKNQNKITFNFFFFILSLNKMSVTLEKRIYL
ncbi:uncharacterized protein METZ01_LOCUS180830 [marine metagenome]|uniref:Uncharacterized protein n=1 Tax=marine metagenome TaxID=408172 RepID=A0A382CPA6_9ZZZZ